MLALFIFKQYFSDFVSNGVILVFIQTCIHLSCCSHTLHNCLPRAFTFCILYIYEFIIITLMHTYVFRMYLIVSHCFLYKIVSHCNLLVEIMRSPISSERMRWWLRHRLARRVKAHVKGWKDIPVHLSGCLLRPRIFPKGEDTLVLPSCFHWLPPIQCSARRMMVCGLPRM